ISTIGTLMSAIRPSRTTRATIVLMGWLRCCGTAPLVYRAADRKGYGRLLPGPQCVVLLEIVGDSRQLGGATAPHRDSCFDIFIAEDSAGAQGKLGDDRLVIGDPDSRRVVETPGEHLLAVR